jgi:hypothetical protein
MAFREVSVVQIREALRRWLKGEGERPIAHGIGVDRNDRTALHHGRRRARACPRRWELTDELIEEPRRSSTQNHSRAAV